MLKKIICANIIFLFFCLAYFVPAAAGESEIPIVVTGIGKTEQEATREAYRNAVQQAMGTLLLSQTIIEDDSLIQDKIVAHSDGYVTKSRKIGSAESLGDGLVKVTIAAVVATDRIARELRNESTQSSDMDGGSLFAKTKTRQERGQTLGDVIAFLVEEATPKLIKATAEADGIRVEKGGVVVPVKIEVNQNEYAAFCREIREKLTRAGAQSFGKQAKLSYWTKKRIMVEPNPLLWRDAPGNITVALCEQLDLKGDQSRWTIFYIDETSFSGFTSALKRHIVKVDILDRDDRAIASQRFPLYKKSNSNPNIGENPSTAMNSYIPIFAWNKTKGKKQVPLWTASIVPLVAVSGFINTARGEYSLGMVGADSTSVEIVFTLSEAELQASRRIECTIIEE